MEIENLTVSQVGNICDCHFNTVKNYTAKGYIQAARDNNGFRRYSLQEALKLKEILSIRRRVGDE
jgi:DNA-binding transcriptional MerR regulator